MVNKIEDKRKEMKICVNGLNALSGLFFSYFRTPSFFICGIVTKELIEYQILL